MRSYSLPNYKDIKDELRPLTSGDVVAAYEDGFIGSYFDPEEYEKAKDAIESDGGKFDMADVAYASGFAGQAKEGIYLLYKEIEALGLPLRTISRVSQPCGNCVSRGTQSALYHLMCVAVRHGNGSLPEGIHEAAKDCNPIASEVNYWWRSNAPNGDGWYAGACLRAAKEHGGIVVRRDFSDIGGPDLRKETTATAHAYSSRTIPDAMRKAISGHPLLSYAECNTFEEIADAISAGHPVQTDGGEGFSKTLDQYGVAHRQGSWSHSMLVSGVITTPEFKKHYNTAGGLVFQNSWAAYLKTDHVKVMGTNFGIPEGSFIALWESVKNRSYYAVSDAKMWENRKMPNWNLGDLI